MKTGLTYLYIQFYDLEDTYIIHSASKLWIYKFDTIKAKHRIINSTNVGLLAHSQGTLYIVH